MRLTLLLGIALSLGACKKQQGEPPPPTDPNRPTPISDTEVKRGNDACQALIDKSCKCADSDKAPQKQESCALAKGYPEAIRVALEVAASPDSTRRDILQAHDSMRKTVKTCVELIAKLPTTGCL
ncbi:MAG: hypothetical protein H0T79_15930 [Deltaproteobacteria bacterium]|nr:hypothetical protein [Deltaproteobacteria bacterium]